MKIKRTFAPTMREALNIVKLEQGDDAVILGNNKVPGGVEIISAIDYDQAQINAELSAQAALQRKKKQIEQQGTPPVSVKPSKPTKDLLSEVATNMSSNRQEPIFGEINVTANISANRPKAVIKNHYEVPKPAAKTAFDWQSDSPKIKGEAINFDGKVHAENLLNSIKDLQAQLLDAKPEPVVASKTTAEVAETSRYSLATQTSDEPVTIKIENSIKDQAESLKVVAQQEEPKVKASPQNEMQPALDEMKEEMRNMRQLMQSQLTTLDWGNYKQRNPVRTVLLNLLTELGIGADICERVINQMEISQEDPQLMWRHAMGLLSKLLPVNNQSILDDGGIVALVGSTGVGKTTTIAKIAARFAHIHGKRSVALISTDNFRIGAQEQLQQYAKLLQIPLLTANSSEELSDCLAMLTDKKLVLIDTAGVSQNDMRLSEQFHTLQEGSPQIQPLLVLSANTQLAALNQTIKNFDKVRLAGSVVTKIDEAASLGGVITTSIRHHLPINFCGLGQQVPEDLELAKSHRLISKAVALMQQYKETPNAETMAMRFNKIVSFGA